MAKEQSSNQVEFYVSKAGQQQGPWTLNEVAVHLASGDIAVTDFIYDDERADWVALLEFEPLKAHLNSSKPKAAPPKKAAPIPQAKVETAVEAKVEAKFDDDKTARVEEEALAKAFASRRETRVNDGAAEWFVQKGPNRYGPFTYLGVVRALQEKTVYEFDLVWKEGMNEWVRIALHEDFTPDRIRGLATESAKSEGVFQQRRHKRIAFESEVIVHDNRSVWLGRAFEGSAGGSGLVIENAALVPGQTVLLHFAAQENLPAFNALCEIVGKKFSNEIRDAKSPVQYSVRFVKLDSQAQPRVEKFFGGKVQLAS